MTRKIQDLRGITRRQAIGTGGALALGAFASGLLGCSSDNDATRSSNDSDIAWDKETDVVVIGAGTGVYTALKAQSEGLSCIVLEKNASAGGSTIYSSSVVWAPANSIMAAKGDEDSREEALAYLEAGAGDTYLPELAEAFVDNVNPALENVTALAGIEWEYWGAGIDYSCFLPGSKTMGRSLIPVVEEGSSTAGALASALINAAEAAGVEILCETPGIELISRKADDGTSEIIGVVAEKGGQRINIKARRAVVLAAGGFDWNDSMMQDYLRSPAHYSWGVPTATGDGQKMAMKAGCDMRFMNEAWMSPGYLVEHAQAKEMQMSKFASLIRDDPRRGIIFVNAQGKRFTNECANYDTVGRSFTAYENNGERRGWANLPAYAIVDQAAVDAWGFNGGEPGAPGESYTQYKSLEELASACNINEENLLAEVARFNENASAGIDPDFGRGQDYYGQNSTYTDANYEGPARTLAPLATPPFYAAEIVPVMLGTMGGVKVNAKAQALDIDGSVVARLYGQGNCAGVGAGGVFYAGGGGTIAPALAFGEIAANDFLQLENWK